MRNPRMMVTFTEPQMDYLKEEAERLGITVADVVRRIVDAHRNETGISALDKLTAWMNDRQS